MGIRLYRYQPYKVSQVYTLYKYNQQQQPIFCLVVLVETLAANSYHVNKHYKRKERIKSKLDPESDYYDPNLLARLEARKANAKVTRQKRNEKQIQSVKEKSGEKLRILRQLSLNKVSSIYRLTSIDNILFTTG